VQNRHDAGGAMWKASEAQRSYGYLLGFLSLSLIKNHSVEIVCSSLARGKNKMTLLKCTQMKG